MATIWANSGKIAVRFRINGQKYLTQFDLPPNKTNLRAAKALSADYEHALRSGTPWAEVKAAIRGEESRPEAVPAATRTLGFYAQHVLDTYQGDSSTVSSYQSIYNCYWSKFDERPIDTLVLSELQRVLSEAPIGLKTKKNALSVLRIIFEIAKADGAITRAPTDLWAIESKHIKIIEADPYTREERDQLLDCLRAMADEYDPAKTKRPNGQPETDPMVAYRYFHLAFHTGMRTGELLGLMWDRVTPTHVQVSTSMRRREMKDGTKTNKGTDRTIPIAPVAWSVLESNPTRFRKGHVFLNVENNRYRDADPLMELFAEAHKRTGVRRRMRTNNTPRPYPWRSTFISQGLTEGISLGRMSTWSGDNPTTLQKHYWRCMNDDHMDQKEVERVFGS